MPSPAEPVLVQSSHNFEEPVQLYWFGRGDICSQIVGHFDSLAMPEEDNRCRSRWLSVSPRPFSEPKNKRSGQYATNGPVTGKVLFRARAQRATAFFSLPSEPGVELGMQFEM